MLILRRNVIVSLVIAAIGGVEELKTLHYHKYCLR